VHITPFSLSVMMINTKGITKKGLLSYAEDDEDDAEEQDRSGDSTTAALVSSSYYSSSSSAVFLQGLMKSRIFGNPSLLESAIATFGIDEYGTNFPPDRLQSRTSTLDEFNSKEEDEKSKRKENEN
jgi:hypothetical protein